MRGGGSWRLEVLGPLELNLQAVMSHQVWVLNLGPLKEQYVFLTTELSYLSSPKIKHVTS